MASAPEPAGSESTTTLAFTRDEVERDVVRRLRVVEVREGVLVDTYSA